MSALQYARVAWSRGVYTSLREVLQAMKEGRDVEMRLINKMMSDILNKTERAVEEIGRASFGRVMSSATPNLFGLDQVIKERSSYYSDRLNDYKFLIKKFDNPGIAIGRRGQDIVRELSLDTLEEGFLKGNPTAFTETELIDRIVKSPKAVNFTDRASAEAAMKNFHGDVVDKIPLFHEDGEAKFMLRVKTKGEYTVPARYQAWSTEKYADLVAITTAGEADTAATIAHARELGTRLIKWNSTGKGKAFYMSIGDKRCAAVDGEIASLEEGGTTINGVTYRYWRDILPGPYNTCHPYCQHRPRALAEEFLGEAVSSAPAASPKIVEAQKEAEGYGVSKVDFGSDKNLPIAENINKVLKGLVESGKPVPRKIIFDRSEFSNMKDAQGRKMPGNQVPAFFRRSRISGQPGDIYFNPAATLFKDVQKTMTESFNRGWFSSDRADHVVHHEVAHFLHNHKLKNEIYQFFKETPLTDKQISLIIQEVSEYATYNPLEFVAETYAGLRAGRKYSDEIMRLYAYFGGV